VQKKLNLEISEINHKHGRILEAYSIIGSEIV